MNLNHGWRRARLTNEERDALRTATPEEYKPVYRGGEEQPGRRASSSRRPGNASHLYAPARVGEPMKVHETYLDDTINVRGVDVSVRREEFRAIENAAKEKKQTVQQFVHALTNSGSIEMAKRALRNAIVPHLPEDFRWVMAATKDNR